VLGLFGEDDANPSPADMRKLDAELTRHGKVHEFHAYPGAGHAFMNRRGERYRADADRDSWPKTLAFFAKHLTRATAVAS
jgi:carboxymethylenebutenolidase